MGTESGVFSVKSLAKFIDNAGLFFLLSSGSTVIEHLQKCACAPHWSL
jgi:hypothetical protein